MKEFFKLAYNAIPLKKAFFLILRAFHPPHSLYQHLYFKDIFTVPVEKSSFKIMHYGFQLENDLFWCGLNGGWEKISLNLWGSCFV